MRKNWVQGKKAQNERIPAHSALLRLGPAILLKCLALSYSHCNVIYSLVIVASTILTTPYLIVIVSDYTLVKFVERTPP